MEYGGGGGVREKDDHNENNAVYPCFEQSLANREGDPDTIFIGSSTTELVNDNQARAGHVLQAEGHLFHLEEESRGVGLDTVVVTEP